MLVSGMTPALKFPSKKCIRVSHLSFFFNLVLTPPTIAVVIFIIHSWCYLLRGCREEAPCGNVVKEDLHRNVVIKGTCGTAPVFEEGTHGRAKRGMGRAVTGINLTFHLFVSFCSSTLFQDLL